MSSRNSSSGKHQKRPRQSTALYRWHGTLHVKPTVQTALWAAQEPASAPVTNLLADALTQWIAAIAKRWAFQLELGSGPPVTVHRSLARSSDQGRPVHGPRTRPSFHFQLELTLKIRLRISSLRRCCAQSPLASTLKRLHWTAASTNSTEQFGSYATKQQTRTAGPWLDPATAKTMATSIGYVPRQARVAAWRPWQSAILKTMPQHQSAGAPFDARHVNVLIDPRGGHGKTVLATNQSSQGFAISVPPVNSFKELVQTCMGFPPATTYFFDIPRAASKRTLGEFYAGIESIKSGVMWDLRYHAKVRYFDSPCVWVFTNVPPDRHLLSWDRWLCWEIVNDQLVPYVEPPPVVSVPSVPN